ncbi:hypothetical protein SOCEGT47_012700 [Sorangium cellulosum]|uniref:Uncharacterized protein n=1 Tax=Sorangium cellulosum TaxID=56 RepID=A0A4P2PWC4_SORCE|nr:hypothetical protein [Sorangium cellulosum]AUX20796.1 hypothetical protein SOCEGT47_012700 [Sorangium cellulosum]
MDELRPGERALLNALRDADEPTDDDRRRMRAAVWARIGLAGAAATAVTASAASAAGAGSAGAGAAGAGAAGAGSAGAASAGAAGATSAAVAKGTAVTLLGAPLKIGLATIVVGLATGAAVYLPASGDPLDAPRAVAAARIADPTPRALRAAAPSSAPSDESAPPAEASAPAEARASAEASAPAEASTPAEASAAPAMGAAPRAPAPRSPAPRSPAPRSPAPAAAAAARPGAEGLDAEIALLRDAQQALQAGQFAQALAKLNEHASRYPRGVLSTEREASRAIALCRSGRAASGRTIAARLLAKSPGSPLATRVRAACGKEE